MNVIPLNIIRIKLLIRNVIPLRHIKFRIRIVIPVK